MVAQLIRKFTAFQGTQRFVTVVRFEVLTTATMNTTVFGDVMLWSPVEVKRFGGTYSLHHQGGRGRQAQWNVKKLVAWFPPRSIWRKQYISPKRWNSASLHGVTSQYNTRRRSENLRFSIKINSFSRILNEARETKVVTKFAEFETAVVS